MQKLILYFLMMPKHEKKEKRKFKVTGNFQMVMTYLIKVSKWLNGRRKKGGGDAKKPLIRVIECY